MNKNLQLVYVAASSVLLLSSIAFFFNVKFAEYFFAASVLALIAEKLFGYSKTKDADFRKKRLRRIELYSLAVLVLAAYTMIAGKTYWIPLILIYALVTLFLSYRD